jgi:hypothetical protein
MTSRRILGELCLFVCVLAIFAGETTALAQVRIKERVEILPAPMSPDNRTLTEPTGAEMITSAGGVLKVKVNYLTSLNSPIPTDAHISIHVHDTTYTIPVSEYAGETAENAGAASDYCNLIFWLPVTEYVRSFREGMDSLYQLSGIEAGDTIVFTYDGGVVAGGVAEMDTDSTWDVYLSQRDDCLHSIAFPHGAFDRVWCWLTATISSVDGSVDHFAVRIVPDTLSEKDTVAFTETARLFVDARGSGDEDIELDGSTLLSFSMESNDQYGTFIGVTGDTVKASPVNLQNVTYQDAHDGKVKFAALWRNPDSMVMCKIRVALQTDPAKQGERDAVVLEKTLKIMMERPYEVQPVISPATVTNPRAENRKQFAVQMTRGNKPVQNHPFKLTTNYVDGSGGHDHLEPRRAQGRANYGHLSLTRTGARYDLPYDGEIQSNAREDLEYIASLFGDTMRVCLQSRRNALLVDTVSVVEMVPGLLNFGTAGQSCIFAQSATGEARHHDNNWCTAQMAASLQQAITDFYDWSVSEEGGAAPILLSLNDMSLPLGGRFDIDGLWDRQANQHYYHRRGTSVDINNVPALKTRDPVSNEIVLSRVGRRLDRIMSRHGGVLYPEPQIHYDFNGRR